jgi:hypothetical protein
MSQKLMSRHVVVALAVALSLGGCSGPAGESDAPPVATLQSGAPAAASSTPAGEDARPLVRLDATDEEREALTKVWMDCVRTEGGAGYEEPKLLFKYLFEGDAKAKKVEATCHPKEPETYEDRQRRTDVSAFRDNQRQWFKCAEKAGYKLTKPNEDGEFGITEVGPNGDFGSPKMENCRKEAFKD